MAVQAIAKIYPSPSYLLSVPILPPRNLPETRPLPNHHISIKLLSASTLPYSFCLAPKPSTTPPPSYCQKTSTTTKKLLPVLTPPTSYCQYHHPLTSTNNNTKLLLARTPPLSYCQYQCFHKDIALTKTFIMQLPSPTRPLSYWTVQKLLSTSCHNSTSVILF
jgi:hypothetical protein